MVRLANPRARVHTIGSHVHDYDSALKFLGSKKSRTLTGNTVVHWDGQGPIHVRYHKTNIITYLPSGAIIVDTGGWKTKTTLERLNELLPGGFRITGGINTRRGDYSEKRPWKIRAPGNESTDFFDGIILQGMPSVSHKFLKDTPSHRPHPGPSGDSLRRNPSKFYDTVEEMCYSNPDQELGESDGFGWYGLISGFLLPDAWDIVKNEGIDPQEFEADAEEYDWPLNAIISEDSQGFIRMETYKNNRDAIREWHKLEQEYETFNS